MIVAAVALAVATVALKGAGPVIGRLPEGLQSRLAGLAPALLAALVAVEVAGADGIPDPDARAAGVAVAIALATVRAPLAVTVIAGAAVTAALRALA